jgi:hypothetical protein
MTFFNPIFGLESKSFHETRRFFVLYLDVSTVASLLLAFHEDLYA